MGEEPLLLCYSVKNCYTNTKPCPVEKNQEVLISVVLPLFHIVAHCITDTKVNVKKGREPPPQIKTKSTIHWFCMSSVLPEMSEQQVMPALFFC